MLRYIGTNFFHTQTADSSCEAGQLGTMFSDLDLYRLDSWVQCSVTLTFIGWTAGTMFSDLDLYSES